ncbi:DinB family protein [Hymenobacter saemangeumensis]|uniref:DinB family protein n=1 Tax=Hymenobacter saemangeumensis TaxID=1084522 RepID=A0ABP8HZL1_9BACT
MLTALAPAPQAQAFLPELAHELHLTRRVLERAPEAYFGWQPHPKSMTLGKLSSHVADLLANIASTLRTAEYDLANYAADHAELPATSAELLRRFDAGGADSQAALEEASAEAFEQAWTLRHGDYIILQQPRTQIVRHLISHCVHHRGQLSLYLRLLDVPVPSIYGPSADEPAA